MQNQPIIAIMEQRFQEWRRNCIKACAECAVYEFLPPGEAVSIEASEHEEMEGARWNAGMMREKKIMNNWNNISKTIVVIEHHNSFGIYKHYIYEESLQIIVHARIEFHFFSIFLSITSYGISSRSTAKSEIFVFVYNRNITRRHTSSSFEFHIYSILFYKQPSIARKTFQLKVPFRVETLEMYYHTNRRFGIYHR